MGGSQKVVLLKTPRNILEKSEI